MELYLHFLNTFSWHGAYLSTETTLPYLLTCHISHYDGETPEGVISKLTN